MEVKIEKSWKEALANEFAAPYFSTLSENIRKEYLSTIVYPPPAEIFAAFNQTPLPDVRVVILGQDPYHGTKQANGLAFSVHDDCPIPPSLKNIYKEIESDIGTPIPSSGNLERWAKQGVLLLNSTLTVRVSEAGAHQGLGWETFTDAVIHKISQERQHVVFMLWGSYAAKKGAGIDTKKHLVLKCAHPSPLSAYRGFFGCKHFSKANEYLASHGMPTISW